MKSMKKTIALVVAIALLVGGAVGGTLAWLVANSGPVTNTFTASDINITLAESTTDYKMVPGNKIAKDPKVTVQADSEDCWLFVKIEKSANYDTYLEQYQVAEGWTALPDEAGVYYRAVDVSENVGPFNVLKGITGDETYADGYVTVKTSVTKEQMAAIKTSGQPTLTFTAYAVQSANITDADGDGTAADEAWAQK